MATKVETAHAMMVRAARMKDSGERNDVEAGMAKYLAAEYCNEVVEDSFRIHGGYGYSKEYEIERLYREAAFMLIGEGTADIQKMIIGRACSRTTSSRAEARPPGGRAASGQSRPYGGATPHPHRGTGACSSGVASADELHGEPAAPLGVRHQRGALTQPLLRRDLQAPCLASICS